MQEGDGAQNHPHSLPTSLLLLSHPQFPASYQTDLSSIPILCHSHLSKHSISAISYSSHSTSISASCSTVFTPSHHFPFHISIPAPAVGAIPLNSNNWSTLHLPAPPQAADDIGFISSSSCFRLQQQCFISIIAGDTNSAAASSESVEGINRSRTEVGIQTTDFNCSP